METEKEEIAILKTSQRFMIDKIESVDKKVDKLDVKIDSRFDVLIEVIEKKCAGKWTERVLKGVIGVIGVAVLSAGLKGVFK